MADDQQQGQHYGLAITRSIDDHPLVKAFEGHDCLYLCWGGQKTQILIVLDLIYERIAHGEI